MAYPLEFKAKLNAISKANKLTDDQLYAVAQFSQKADPANYSIESILDWFKDHPNDLLGRMDQYNAVNTKKIKPGAAQKQKVILVAGGTVLALLLAFLLWKKLKK